MHADFAEGKLRGPWPLLHTLQANSVSCLEEMRRLWPGMPAAHEARKSHTPGLLNLVRINHLRQTLPCFRVCVCVSLTKRCITADKGPLDQRPCVSQVSRSEMAVTGKQR